MATRSCAFSKKMVFTSQGYVWPEPCQPVAKSRLRQIDAPVGPLSDFHSLQYANNVRLPLTVNPLQTLTLSRNQRINPQTRSAQEAV